MKYFVLLLTLAIIPCPASAQTTYQGREHDAPWRAEARERIEQYRMADVVVKVLDSENNPVPDAQVHLRMKSHAFPFGSAVGAAWLTGDSSDSEQYRNIVAHNYNQVVLENDLKFGPWESGKTNPLGSTYRMEQTFAALEWLKNHDIAVRGHYLAWGWTNRYRFFREEMGQPEEFLEIKLDHIREKMMSVGNLVQEWDALNHPLSRDGRETLETVYGSEIYLDILRLARELQPEIDLYINEGGLLPIRARSQENLDEYEVLITRLLEQGAPLDGIGFMGHMAKHTLRPPEDLLRIIDRFAAFGLPVKITEFDVIFGKKAQLYDFADWELELQADYTRDFMTAMFSHPAVNGIIMWGFWEGRHWYPGAALYRHDWSIKPNGQAWMDLVFDEWWTDVQGMSDAHGMFEHRGFLGDYEVEVNYGDTSITLPVTLSKGQNSFEVLLPL